jgi:hypothetical protein
MEWIKSNIGLTLQDAVSKYTHLAEQAKCKDLILEAAASGFSAQWVRVQEGVSQFAKAVSYDRTGLGWNEPSHKQPTGLDIATQLHIALENAGLEPLYILVIPLAVIQLAIFKALIIR